jgi:hypothetical protein
MCVLWLPLEDQEHSIEFVRGSPPWNRLFVRVWFKDPAAAAAAQWVNGKFYESTPDINADRDHFEKVTV